MRLALGKKEFTDVSGCLRERHRQLAENLSVKLYDLGCLIKA